MRAVASSDRRGARQPTARSRCSTWSSDLGATLSSKGKRWPRWLLAEPLRGWLATADRPWRAAGRDEAPPFGNEFATDLRVLAGMDRSLSSPISNFPQWRGQHCEPRLWLPRDHPADDEHQYASEQRQAE